jgi:hypothetical protein
MHETLCKDVRAHIDTLDSNGNYSGWCYHNELGCLPLRLVSDATVYQVTVVQRDDVVLFFGRPDIDKCGWSVTNVSRGSVLEISLYGVWRPVLELQSQGLLTREDLPGDLFNSYKLPSFVVVDNFYKDPDAVRAFAMKQTFQENPNFHKGKRCINPEFRFPGLKEQFEKILGAKIKDWNAYGTNGCFQYCIAGEQAVYHSDTQQYAGVLFLTPDAPPQTGTQFFRSKVTKKMKTELNEYGIVYKTGHLDSTQFDQVDVVGNVYNRVVLFDARMIHAAPLYFGTDIGNGRLFQLFFFDIE